MSEKFNQDRLGRRNDNLDVYELSYNSNTIRMERSIATDTRYKSGAYHNKKKRVSWSTVDNEPLMIREKENGFWLLF